MWKLIVLPFLLVVIQATNLDNFLGKAWTLVAKISDPDYVPICLGANFNKALHDADCNCTDGKNAILVESVQSFFTYFKDNGPVEKYMNVGSHEFPLIGIDSPSEIALDVNCTCGSLHFTSRRAVRTIDEDYVVIYLGTAGQINEHVLATKITKKADLDDVLKNIEDLKNKEHGIICASDISLFFVE